MAESNGSPRPVDLTPIKTRPANPINNLLIDSDGNSKSLAMRFQSPGNPPPNTRKSQRNSKGKNLANDETVDSTDDDYFLQLQAPKQQKDNIRTRKTIRVPWMQLQVLCLPEEKQIELANRDKCPKSL